jgi:hypothetical protein
MLAADDARMSGIERVRIHTHLGVPNTDKNGTAYDRNTLDYLTKFTSHLPSTVMK